MRRSSPDENFSRIKNNILYEDNHLLIVNKECGILSQPDASGDADLFNLCKNYIKIQYEKPGNVYLGLIHRLDLSVSGITVFAKTSKAAKRMSEIFRTRSVSKIYTAVVEGNVAPEESDLKDKILKDEKNRVAFSSPEGQNAELRYRVLKKGNAGTAPVSLLEIQLHTGRFHQIRFQFSSRGFPVLGDVKYGSAYRSKSPCIYLQASRITFEHPVKKTLLTVQSPRISEWDRFFSTHTE